MRSKERRKVIPQFTKALGTWAKWSAAGVLAGVSILASAAIGQETADGPVFSVYRRNVGVVSLADGKRTVQLSSGEGVVPVAGDFDADGLLDAGLFDAANRMWTVRRSSDGSTLALSFPIAQRKNPVRAEPAAADIDGDGQTDPVVFCAGAWQIYASTKPGSLETVIFGKAGDVPVPADYDGDGKADLTVFRPSENRWYIRSSETGAVSTADLGIAGTDKLVPADYSGDGKADVAVYRRGRWIMIDSQTGMEETFEFGFEDASPAPGDFNRDGRVDFAVFRKGIWYVYDGSSFVSFKFGSEEDVPLTISLVRESTASL